MHPFGRNSLIFVVCLLQGQTKIMQTASSFCRGCVFPGHAVRYKGVIRIESADTFFEAARPKGWQVYCGLHENKHFLSNMGCAIL